MSTPETGPNGRQLTPEQAAKMAAYEAWAAEQRRRETQIVEEIARLEDELEIVKNHDVCERHTWHDGTSAVYDGECLLCGVRP